MKHEIKLLLKVLCYIILFAYFGFIVTAKIRYPFTGMCLLPIFLLVVVGLGGWGTVGIISAKIKQESFHPKHIFFVQLALFGFLLFVASYTINYLRYNQKFDPQIWQDPKSANFIKDDITPRQKMVDDLVKNVLPGKNKAEILALLGKSAGTECYSSMGCDISYILGKERLIPIESEWLLIWLDGKDNFLHYEIVIGTGTLDTRSIEDKK